MMLVYIEDVIDADQVFSCFHSGMRGFIKIVSIDYVEYYCRDKERSLALYKKYLNDGNF